MVQTWLAAKFQKDPFVFTSLPILQPRFDQISPGPPVSHIDELNKDLLPLGARSVPIWLVLKPVIVGPCSPCLASEGANDSYAAATHTYYIPRNDGHLFDGVGTKIANKV